MKRAWLALSLLAIAARPGIEEPRQYNQGVTAYRSNDFTTASQSFEQALPSKDSRLREQALYNLGNTLYRIGAAQPQQAQQIWQRAIKNYENALALDPKDEDAKFNREFVKKKLEELQKQQQQQQQNQQDKKQDQKKDDQQQQPKSDDKKDQQQKPEDQQKQDQKEKQQKPEQQTKPQQGQADKMEKQQAKALLDNLREEERNWNFFPEVQMKDLKDSRPPAKDW